MQRRLVAADGSFRKLKCLWKMNAGQVKQQSQQRSHCNCIYCSMAVLNTCGVNNRKGLYLMQLYLAPQCLGPATCRLRYECPRTSRVRSFRKIGCTHPLRHRSVTVGRQLTLAGTVASASDGKQVDHATVGPVRQLELWTAVDAAATIGSIIGALAFFITSEAILASIPVILPLVAWYAGRQKEGLQVKVSNAFSCIRLLLSRWALLFRIGSSHVC